MVGTRRELPLVGRAALRGDRLGQYHRAADGRLREELYVGRGRSIRRVQDERRGTITRHLPEPPTANPGMYHVDGSVFGAEILDGE